MPGPFDVELREPTGLPLGWADPVTVRQQLYEGRLPPTLQFREPEGEWRPLHARPEFARVIRLVQADRPALRAGPAARSRFSGWRREEGEGDSDPRFEAVSAPPASPGAEPEGPAPGAPGPLPAPGSPSDPAGAGGQAGAPSSSGLTGGLLRLFRRKD
ncbi:hypothetical protein L6R50_08615 [Myxococcota bacterium]|nr:hypothetical protein [Myxococcota bacterium]